MGAFNQTGDQILLFIFFLNSRMVKGLDEL